MKTINNLMARQPIALTSILIFSLCLLSACQFSGGENAAANNRQTNETKQSGDEKSNDKTGDVSTTASNSSIGLCANKYFPVAEGNSRRYVAKQVGEKSVETSYTQSYQPGAASFSETQKLNNGKDTTVKVDWTCLPEGLQTATYGQFLMTNKVGMTLETKKAEGITLLKEADWKIGEKWTSSYDIGGHFDSKIIKGEVSGKVTMNHEIVVLDEKVTVPAGEFSAAKVKVIVDMNINFRGQKLPSENFTTINWFAPGIGLIKQEVTGGLGKSSLEYLGK